MTKCKYFHKSGFFRAESDTTSESEHRSVLSEEYWKKIDEVVSTESDDASFEIEVSLFEQF